MVHRRTRVTRSHFNRLPKGAAFFLTNGNGPYVKITNTAYATANSLPQNAPAGTTMTPANTSVVRFDKWFSGQRAIG